MDATATYLYCITRAGLTASALEGTGIDGRSTLALEPYRDIAAVVSAVSLDDFTGEEAEARLQDVEWLTPRVLRHERVIEQVASVAPVLPVRFGTLFTARESLGQKLAERHDEIAQFLERVADKEEWAVKGFVDRKRATAAVAARARAQAGEASGSAGARYIRAQRARLASDETVGQWLHDAAERVWDDLMHHASSGTERRVLPAGAGSAPGDMVLNWAFLVPKAEVGEFRTRIERFNEEQAERGFVLRESGAWPPFSFTPTIAQSDA